MRIQQSVIRLSALGDDKIDRSWLGDSWDLMFNEPIKVMVLGGRGYRAYPLGATGPLAPSEKYESCC
jgi:hypothetical protein